MPYSRLRSYEAPGGIKFLALLNIFALLLPSFAAFPSTAFAANVAIRQEINITDAYYYAASGAYATSSEIANLDSTKYNGATYYFEVVASTTSAVNATVSLVNATSSVAVTSVTVNGTSYARYRSVSFSAPGVATDYVVKLGNEAVGKGILAARIVILQNATSITSTETQVEVGNNETYTATATSTFAAPKYWLYDSSKWDGSPTFSAEVTYQALKGVASSTSVTTSGTYTIRFPNGTASSTIELWGGGGAGGGSPATSGDDGAGGAGGQFASSTLLATTTSHTLVVAATKAGTSGANGGAGNNSTWDTGVIVAAGGGGGGVGTSATVASTTGNTTGCVGQVCFAGGNGGAGVHSTYGGGGGGGAGTTGVGGSATGAGVAGSGTTVGGGAGGAKKTSAGAGSTGTAAGGGGSGAFTASAVARAGGTGAAGRADIFDVIATTTIAIQEDDGTFNNWTDKAYIVVASSAVLPGQPIRIRSSSFTPTSGRNYRIAFSSLDSRQKFAIYNAKVIVDQTSPTMLEPQYLLSNTKLAGGTALQKYLTSWNSAEWSGASTLVFTYIHEVDAAASSASVAEVDTSGGVQVTGSVVSSPSNRAQSSAMTMPSNGDLDVKATTNNNDVYADRILVQVAPPSLTFSGTLYNLDAASAYTGTSKTIKLAIGTPTPSIFTGTTNSGDGTWSITASGITSTALGQDILAWVSGDSQFRATTFTKASTTANNIPKIDLYRNRVTVKMEGFTGTSTTNTDLGFYNGNDDPDIQFTTSGGVLSVNKSEELRIAPGTEFAPGGQVILNGNASTTNPDGDLSLPFGLRQDGTATSSILTMDVNELDVAGNWFASSSAIYNTSGTTVFTSTSTQQKSIIATSTPFSALTFNGSGGSWTFGNNSATTTGAFTITAGTVTAPSTVLAVGGNFSRSGAFVHNSGTTTFSGTVNQTISSIMIGSNAFNNVEFRGSGPKTFANVASTTNFYISSSAIGGVTAPSTRLTISGNYANNLIFTANNGTVYFDSSSPQYLLGFMTGTSAFATTTFIGAGTKTIASKAIFEGSLTINAGATVVAPASLEVGGSFVQNGAFTANGGSLTLIGVGPWNQIGNSFSITSTPAIASLSSTDIAYIDPSNSTLSDYHFDGTNWALVGSGLSIATVGTPALTGLSATDVAFIDSTNDTLSDYHFDGSNWALVGNGLSIATVGAPALTALSATDVAFYDVTNHSLRDYHFDGTNWSLVGSGLSLIIDRAALTALNATDVAAFIHPNAITVYRFNGSTWSQVGSGFTTAGIVTNPSLAKLTSNVISYFDSFNDKLQTYYWDGSVWELVGQALSHSASVAALAALSQTRIALDDGSHIITYDIGGTRSVSGTLNTAATALSSVEFAGPLGWTVSNNASTTADVTIDSGATVIAPPLFTIGGNYTNNGTFTAGTGLTYFDSTSAQSISGALTDTSAFASTTFNGSGTKTFANNASTTADFTINSGATVIAPPLLTIGGNYTNNGTYTAGPNLMYFDNASPQTIAGTLIGPSAFASTTFIGGTKTFANNASTTADFTINSGATVIAPPFLTVGGNYTNNGIFTAGSGTLYFSSTTAQTIAGTLTGTSAFASTTFIGAATKTFSNNASSTGPFLINSGATVVAPSLLTLGGDYTNNGTFTAGTGTTTLGGSANQTLAGALSGSSAFSNLEILNTAGTTTIANSASTTANFFATTPNVHLAFAPSSTLTVAGNFVVQGTSGNLVNLFSSSPGSTWNINAPTSVVTYARVKDGNACSYTSITTDGTDVDAGGNTCWFPAALSVSSAANQIFTIGDASTPISQLTVTDGGIPSITAANKLRIAISTSTTFMLWDTSKTTATFGGTASGKVSNPVSYEGDGSVLLVPVGTNFVANDTLTISGLNFTSFTAASPALPGLKLFVHGASDQTAAATNAQTVAIKGAFTPGEHTGGQVTNTFAGGFPGNYVHSSLYAFNLLLNGENVTVTSLPITLSGVQGISAGDITSAALFIDYNGNKIIDAGDTQVGGTGSVAIANQTGTITFSSPFTATTTRNYILRADVANMAFGDSMTLSLVPSNITSSGVTSLISTTPASTVALTSIQHILSTPSGLSIGGSAPAGQGIVSGGGNGGGQSIGSDPNFFPPTTTGGTFNQWTTPSNAYASDDAYATAATTGFRQDYGGFGFSIPSSNTITGIEVKLELSGSTGAGTVSAALSWNGGTSTTTVQTTGTLSSSDTVVTLGGASNTWGRSWVPSEFSDANFKVRLVAQPSGNTVKVDAIQVNVHNVASGGGSGGGGEVLAHPRLEDFASAYEAALSAASNPPSSLLGQFVHILSSL